MYKDSEVTVFSGSNNLPCNQNMQWTPFNLVILGNQVNSVTLEGGSEVN